MLCARRPDRLPGATDDHRRRQPTLADNAARLQAIVGASAFPTPAHRLEQRAAFAAVKEACGGNGLAAMVAVGAAIKRLRSAR